MPINLQARRWFDDQHTCLECETQSPITGATHVNLQFFYFFVCLFLVLRTQLVVFKVVPGSEMIGHGGTTQGAGD